jgi:thiol-disulfide isomerase/thioredoxin
MTYLDYRNLIDNLILQNKTTGNDQSEEMINYAKLNIQRMNRLDKTTILNDNWAPFFESLKSNLKWVVLTEGWCGDAAQIVPVINKIAEASNGKIELELLLRDENLEMMDKYLTNGGRAIPKLICYDENNIELWNWGPRPKETQELVNQLKEDKVELNELKTQLHLWYTHNKTMNIQLEIFQNLAQ